MIEIKIRKGEPVERALRRLKKVLVRENVFQEVRKRRYFQKASDAQRAKMKAARFNQMLRQRYADE
jgi:small subunit ribosomal protein S21